MRSGYGVEVQGSLRVMVKKSGMVKKNANPMRNQDLVIMQRQSGMFRSEKRSRELETGRNSV